jgi:hypothetical protein
VGYFTGGRVTPEWLARLGGVHGVPTGSERTRDLDLDLERAPDVMLAP